MLGRQQEFLAVENGGIGALGEIDETDRASREITRLGCKEYGEGDVEWFVVEETYAVAGINLDDVERCVLEAESPTEGGEVIGEWWNSLDESFVIIAERADVLSTPRGPQAGVEMSQGSRFNEHGAVGRHAVNSLA